MRNFTDKIIKLWVILWSFVFFIGVFVNFIEIVLRFFFSYSWDLLYDIPVWCTVWATLLISGPILLSGEHVSIDALTTLIKGPFKKVISLFNAVIVLFFGIIFTYGGYLFVMQLYNFNTAYTRSISIPSWIIEACVPLGLFIFTLCAAIDLIRKIKEKAE